jgi:hypothetical protein
MKLAENLPEKCRLRLPTHLCSFREGQQHSGRSTTLKGVTTRERECGKSRHLMKNLCQLIKPFLTNRHDYLIIFRFDWLKVHLECLTVEKSHP